MKEAAKMALAREERMDFCIECRKETAYEYRKVIRKQVIREKEYDFEVTSAICKECGEEMSIPGLIDLNIEEVDHQYRVKEDIVTIEDIKKLMRIYNIGKGPLSLALGFGEITISRYLEGQMPSKNYSEIMRKALSKPDYMENLLVQNRKKVGETAYKKALKAIHELKSLFQLSDKMTVTIAYLFEQVHEITPLALQKMLYFIQGIYMVTFGVPLYPEECQAWVHGPVYGKVYDLFKDFKYNPIEDNRFVLFEGQTKKLTDDEKRVIDLVIESFGMYSGKILEKITHNEEPWINARQGYDVNECSTKVIEKSDMKEYFEMVSEKYGVDTVDGLNCYILDSLRR